MKTKKLLILVFLAFVGTSFKSYGQFWVDLEYFYKLNSKVTYVPMKDPESEKAKPFIDVYKKYWTLTELKFIKYSEIQKYATPESTFLSFTGINFSNDWNLNHFQLNNGIKFGNHISTESNHLYFDLWYIHSDYFLKNKKGKQTIEDNQVSVASMNIFPDFYTMTTLKEVPNYDYDGDGHLRNWSPGYLKNFIQIINSHHNKSRNFASKENSDTVNEAELRKLASKVLMVPDYILTKFNIFNGDESKSHDVKELFSEYSHKYSIVSADEINKKILDNNDEFYYLMYVKSSGLKYVCVLNSKTGDVIYKRYSTGSYNIKSGDLNEISKKIKKSI